MSSEDIDLLLHYHWQAGSMPPPAHYEYDIRLGPNGAGEIIFYPDYPQHNPPIWSERFALSDQEMSRLRSLISTKKLLTRKWRSPSRSPVGGSLESLELIAADQQISVPSHLNAPDTAAMRPVYDAIRALVPQTLWDSLLARRQAFEDDYLAHNR